MNSRGSCSSKSSRISLPRDVEATPCNCRGEAGGEGGGEGDGEVDGEGGGEGDGEGDGEVADFSWPEPVGCSAWCSAWSSLPSPSSPVAL